jgi:hypothetical protein
LRKPKLRAEVNLRKRTDEVLKKQDIISLREKLSAIEKSREKKIPVRQTRKNLFISNMQQLWQFGC